MGTFESGRLGLAYDIAGPADGPPVILLHGFASSRAETWKRLGWLDAFDSKRYRALAPDLRGHGDSAKPHEAEFYGTAAMVADALALLDHLALPRAHVLGYSMGARIALALAVHHPARVDRLMLGGIGWRVFEEAEEHGGAMAAAMEADSADDVADPLLRGLRQFADAQGDDLEALAACARGPREKITPSMVVGLQAPTLVVAGEQDRLAEGARQLAEALPDAQYAGLPGCDHFSTISHTLFKAAVFDFLDDGFTA